MSCVGRVEEYCVIVRELLNFNFFSPIFIFISLIERTPLLFLEEKELENLVRGSIYCNPNICMRIHFQFSDFVIFVGLKCFNTQLYDNRK